MIYIIVILVIYIFTITIVNGFGKIANNRLVVAQRELIDSQYKMIDALKKHKGINTTHMTNKEHMAVFKAKSNLN